MEAITLNFKQQLSEVSVQIQCRVVLSISPTTIFLGIFIDFFAETQHVQEDLYDILREYSTNHPMPTHFNFT